MNLEQQRAIALAQARRRRAEAEGGGASAQPVTKMESVRPGGMEVFNEGIARGLGAPADFTTWLVNSGLIDGVNALTGSDFGHIENPIGGSDSIRRGFEAIGTDFAGAEFRPEGVVENFTLGSGSAAGSILPMVGGGKALQTVGTPIATAVGDTLAQPFAAAPVRAVTSELAAGGGAGVGMEVADNLAPDNPLAQTLGAVMGGGVAGAGPYLAGQTVKKLPLVSTAVKAVQNDVAPFTEAGAMERARRRMAGLVEDPETAITALKTPTIGNLSPAVSTGERRMMALENVVRDQDPEVDVRMRQAEAEGNEALRQAMIEPGQGVDAQTGRTYMEGAVQQQVDGVGQALDGTFGAPKPNATAMTDLRKSTAPARRTAYDDAYDAEVNLYASDAGRQLETLLSRVSSAAPAALKKANQLMAGRGYESRQILFQEADNGTITFMRKPDTLQLDHITRALRDMADSTDGRGAFGGQNTHGSMISDLSKAIRNNLKQANPLYATALETAATPLGQRDAITFGQGLLKPSLPRDVAAAQIADMTGPELDFVRQSVRAQLDEELANVRMSIANPDAGMREAQRAMTQLSSRAVREKIGMLFPDEEAQALFDQMDSATTMLDPRRSGPALYASARPDEEIRSIMNSPNPRAAAQQIVDQASADPTGQALPSVKGSFIGELMGRARTGSFDEAGQPVLSGRALKNAMNDTRISPVATTLLSMEERSRLSAIADELAKVETASGRLPNVGGIMEGEPNSIISLIARTFAARTGAHAGKGTSGASLLTASWASKRMDQLLRRLTLDKAENLIKQAITGDRELFEALLTPAERWTTKQEGRLLNVLSTTMQGTAAAAIGQMGLGNQEGDEPEGENTGDDIIDIVMRGRKQTGPSSMDREFDSYIRGMM